MYDIFYVAAQSVDPARWDNFKVRYPAAQKLENIVSFDQIKKRAFTKMFWVIWDDVILRNTFDLHLYRATAWDNQYIHIFKNGECYDGICLFPKIATVSQREFDHRFFINKKEIDTIASDPIVYAFDIAFISYHESFAEKHYTELVTRTMGHTVFWIKDIKGIHQAHLEAARQVSTDMFWVVDADAILVDDFNFDIGHVPRDMVQVWRSRNPVNNLEYGYGGIKLLPRKLTLEMDINSADMTTSISKRFRARDTVSNITAFNTDPFNSWKSAFRECCKLASRIIDRQNDKETDERLTIWCEETTDEYALAGARAGREYGRINQTDIVALKKINDFEWLKEQFNG